jgi:hypothetical protein
VQRLHAERDGPDLVIRGRRVTDCPLIERICEQVYELAAL